MSHSVISIHAPTRGATRKPDNNSNNSKFQSTLPRGERRRATEKSEVNKVFQSTLPRGERHKRPLFFVCEANFNPRSHEGSDQTLSSVRCSPQISIHAPTRGATVGIIDRKEILYFNPRSHEGSDVIRRVRFTGNGTISIHAPTRGATCRSWLTSYQILQISIHAPTRGATMTSVSG